MEHPFHYHERLGIALPMLKRSWEELTPHEQAIIIARWQEQRSKIPDRILQLEQEIQRQQALLTEEEDFHRSCEINGMIAELASIIHDLQILFREDPELFSGPLPEMKSG